MGNHKLFQQRQEASFAIRTLLSDLDGKEPGVGASLWFAIDGRVEDLQADLADKGVSTLGTINPTPFGKTIVVQDPDGYQLTFLQPNE